MSNGLVYAVTPENRYVTEAVHCILFIYLFIYFWNRSRCEINSGNNLTWTHAYTRSSVKTL